METFMYTNSAAFFVWYVSHILSVVSCAVILNLKLQVYYKKREVG